MLTRLKVEEYAGCMAHVIYQKVYFDEADTFLGPVKVTYKGYVWDLIEVEGRFVELEACGVSRCIKLTDSELAQMCKEVLRQHMEVLCLEK